MVYKTTYNWGAILPHFQRETKKENLAPTSPIYW
jgi:hypothetical protein